jgi:hypothetical protein
MLDRDGINSKDVEIRGNWYKIFEIAGNVLH